jgi:hypothetical protein
MYKVRFHLGRGENYMKWQITSPCGNKTYLDPEINNLEMVNCKLKNKKSVAKKIFKGENKTVCAWIECEKIHIWPDSLKCDLHKNINYNPKNKPYWTDNSGQDFDDKNYGIIFSEGKKLFV